MFGTISLYIVVPSIILPDSEQALIVTEGANITCTATGYPVPNILWLNDNRTVVDEDRLAGVMAKGVGKLSVVSVSLIIRRNDSELYTCVASNSVGNDSRIINITVQSKLSLRLYYWNIVFFSLAIPIITVPEKHRVTEGDNITCIATGYPVPDVVWLTNSGSKVDKSRLMTAPVMTSDFHNQFVVSVSMIVRRNDSGIYICVANNSVGNNTSAINISVNCKI